MKKQMKNAFNGLIREDIAQERISELEECSTETATSKDKEDNLEQNTQELQDNHKRYNLYVMLIPKGEHKKYLKQ